MTLVTRRRTTSFVTPATEQPPHEQEQATGHVRSLLAEAQALSARLAALNEIAVAMQTSIDADAMLRVMARQARWVLDFQHCAVVTRERSNYRFHVLFGAATPESEPIGALTTRALRGGHALLVDALTPEDGGPPEMQSALILPLHNGNDVVGALNFYARKPQHYTQHDLRIASALALQVAAILQNERLLAAVRNARDELHTVLESIGDGVLVLDRAGRVVLLNRALQRLLSCRADSGSRALALLRCDNQRLLDRATVRELWRSICTGDTRGEHTLALANGCFVEWASAPLLDRGEISGYVLTLRDVSTRVALERLREDMTQMLVHDLRSPLTSIMMGLDILGGRFGDDAEMRDLTLTQVRQASRRMLEQVNTLLDVSKLEAGRLDLDQELHSAHMLVEQVVTPLLPLAQRSQQQVIVKLPVDLPALMCDGRLVRRVLQNLLDNALKFTLDGDTITVGAHHDRAHNSIELWVQDSGPGVPATQRAHIFEKYGQAEGERRGTGLGLTFCKLVVETHGGQIGVRDGPDQGSVFWFALPLTN